MQSDRTTQAKAQFDEIAAELAAEGVVSGNLFGKPALKIGTKAFACQFRDGVAFKLPPDAHTDGLGLDGAALFDPSGKGRPMKEWVQVPVEHAGQWPELASSALRHVRG